MLLELTNLNAGLSIRLYFKLSCSISRSTLQIYRQSFLKIPGFPCAFHPGLSFPGFPPLFIRDFRVCVGHWRKSSDSYHVVGFVWTVGFFLQSEIIGWLSLKMGRKKKKATKPWCWYPLQNNALCRFDPDRSCGRPAFQNLDQGYRLWFRKSCFHKILNPSLCIRSFNRQCYLQHILLLHKNVLGMRTANCWRCDSLF